MRSVLCLLVVSLFATTAVAQFKNGVAPRNAPPANTTQKKTTNEKAHPAKASAAEQAAAETELANALLNAMDADHDGVVTRAELGKAKIAIGKLSKEKGDIPVPDKAAADPALAAAPGADAGLEQGPGGVGAPAGGDQRNENEAMARFLAFDKNGDGKLSVNEVPANERAMAQQADLNRDNVISAAELAMFSRKIGAARMKAFSAGANPNGGAQGNGRNPKP